MLYSTLPSVLKCSYFCSIIPDIAIPLSRYMAWIMDGRYRPARVFGWFEKRLDSGPQSWKQYLISMLIFNSVLFAFGFIILALQKWTPLNPDHKTILAPSTILHSAMSFATNTDLQHYSGDQHLSNFTQLMFAFANFFLSASVGFTALTAIIRAFRSDKSVGNFFLDMWRVVVYLFIPLAFIFAVIFVWQGSPMTLQNAHLAATLEPGRWD